ncbi:hypothetical protein BH23THE1_BH23THE1_31010 [soil metagenome]
MAAPKVSILCLTYNHVKFIRQALDSFLMQKTDFDFEVLINDDCSTDGTVEIIKEYQKKYPQIIKPVFQKENLYSKGIRNMMTRFLLPKAQGKHIALCEGDDYWTDPNKLQLQVDFLEKNTDYALCFHPVRLVYEDKEEIESVFPDRKSGFTLIRLIERNFIQTNSVMYRKQTYKNMRTDVMPGDWYLHLYHAQFGTIGFIDEVMSVYRRHEGGIWWNKKEVWNNDGDKHMNLYTELLKMFGEDKELRKAIVQNIVLAVEHMSNYSDEHLLPPRITQDYPNLISLGIEKYRDEIKDINMQNQDILLERDSRIKALDSRTKVLANENQNLKTEIKKLYSSKSYRIGRSVLLPIRVIRFVKYRFKKYYIRKKNITSVKRTIHQMYGLKISNKYSRPNVSLVVRSIEHPTSSTFVRMVSPLRHIVKEKGWRIELIDGDRPKISRSSKIIIVQRTALINMAAADYVIEKVVNNKAKLYVDTDDAFGDLDVHHPQYDLQKQRVKALNKIISKATMVWFSTSSLQKIYKTKKSRVIRNTLDKKIWHSLEKTNTTIPHPTQPLEIVYMGTKTHDGDFEIIEPVLRSLHDKYPGAFNLHLIGVGDIKSSESWIIRHNPTSGLYPYFVEWFDSIGPFDIGIAPLEDSKFNRSKSDIKCLDYLAIGVKPIVSNVTAYQNKELNQHINRVNNTFDEWFAVLENEILNKDTNRSNAANRIASARQYIVNQRLSQVAGNEILDSLSEEVM